MLVLVLVFHVITVTEIVLVILYFSIVLVFFVSVCEEFRVYGFAPYKY